MPNVDLTQQESTKEITVSVEKTLSASVSVSDTSLSVSVSQPSTPSVTVSENASHSVSVAAVSIPSTTVVAPSPSSVEVSNTIGMAFRIQDLDDVIGTPQDGETLVYDASVGGFVFDFDAGSGGVFTTDVEVTNTDLAMGDATGMTYQDGSSIQRAIVDILNPQKPFIYDYDLQLEYLGSGVSNYVLNGSNFQLKSFRAFFERGDQIFQGSRVELYYNGNNIAQSAELSGNVEFVDITGSSVIQWSSSGNSDSIKIRVYYSENEYYEKIAPIYKVNPIALFTTTLTADEIIAHGNDAFGILKDGQGSDYDGGHERAERASILEGSSHSEDYTKSCIISVPVSFTLETITEMVDGVGTADMTDSFELIREDPFPAYAGLLGLDEYNVYLYRSKQPGALKSKSSLRVKVS